MELSGILNCLEAKWRAYLKKWGHQIYRSQSNFRVVRSCSTKKARYRWLVLVCEQPIFRPSQSEQAYIRRQSKQAKTQRKTTYLVVGFTREPKRIVVLPADRALTAGQVRSDKGGIAWED
jgi:hypothetical protein